MTPDIPAEGITLILGGARSGKSSFAQHVAIRRGKPVLFVATAVAGDAEMVERIQKHQMSRPTDWQTLELPCHLGERLTVPVSDIVIVDCITLLVSNLLLSLPAEAPSEEVMNHVRREMEDLISAQSRCGGLWLIISNEVGCGLVPPNALGRVYRDALGIANQVLAEAAVRVIWMVAGIPVVIK